MKRETGVNPVRSRRCIDGAFFLFLRRKRKPLNRDSIWEGMKNVMMSESEDLPYALYTKEPRGIGLVHLSQ